MKKGSRKYPQKDYDEDQERQQSKKDKEKRMETDESDEEGSSGSETNGNPDDNCDWCNKDFLDPVTLPCQHQICRKCFRSLIHERLKIKRKVRGMKCNELAPLDDLKKYMRRKDKKLFVKVKQHIKVESDPKLFFCPHDGCDKIVGGMKGRRNAPKFATGENGHSFCVLCNKGKHKGKTCEEAKSTWSFYDNPLTRRCPHGKTIIQVPKMGNAKDPEGQVGGKKLPKQKIKHLSTTGNVLSYVFLIFMLPCKAGRWAYKSTGLKDDIKK